MFPNRALKVVCHECRPNEIILRGLPGFTNYSTFAKKGAISLVSSFWLYKSHDYLINGGKLFGSTENTQILKFLVPLAWIIFVSTTLSYYETELWALGE